jgi:ribosome recycling factor
MEEARIEIRGLRRDAAEILKKSEHDGTLGADEARRESEQLQKITDKHIADVDRVGTAKQQEIMEV